MRVYLAARYGRLEELQGYRDELVSAGHEVVARWVNGNHRWSSEQQWEEAQLGNPTTDSVSFAWDDVDDINTADTVISFTELPNSGYSRGGRHVEFGYALGMNHAALLTLGVLKRMVIIGPRENVFHNLPGIEVYGSWGEFIEHDRRNLV